MATKDPKIFNYTSWSDQALAHAIKESDLAAFKVIYYRYYKPLCRFVWVRTYSAELSEDLTQEVFTRLWQNRHRLIIKKSLKAYMYRIANNLLIDFYRKKSREIKYLSKPTPHSQSAYTVNYDEILNLNFAINKLPDKLRTAFYLSRFEGFTYAEIAKSFHISAKTVESRIAKALRLLRKELSD